MAVGQKILQLYICVGVLCFSRKLCVHCHHITLQYMDRRVARLPALGPYQMYNSVQRHKSFGIYYLMACVYVFVWVLKRYAMWFCIISVYSIHLCEYS